jgi:tetratricopeptide (TPR) repeat protein
MLDWPQLIGQFAPLSKDDVPRFAPPREMEQAVATYNKAIFNLSHDNSDIALIALHKLTATYPLFTEAVLLLGYCLAENGHWLAAREHIELAILGGMPEKQIGTARSALLEIEEQEKKLEAPPSPGKPLGGLAWIRPVRKPVRKPVKPVHAGNDGQTETSISPSAILLKTGHRNKMRVASARERRAVTGPGEQPGRPAGQETAPLNARALPAGLVRMTLLVLGGLTVLALLVFAGVFWAAPLIEKSLQRSQSSRLAWLIGRLEELSGQNPVIGQILNDYEKEFDSQPTTQLTTQPTTRPTTGRPTTETTQPTTGTTQPTTAESETSAATTETTAAETTEQPSETTTVAATSEATAANPDAVQLQNAAALYQSAVSVKNADILAAADHLLSARHLLASIPGQTTAPGVTGDAVELSRQVETFIGDIAVTAAYRFWLRGQTSFDAADYQTSLGDNLKAFELNHDGYGGGAAYYCGRCYQLLGDYAAAKPFFDYVVEHFAGRDIAASAAARLEQMGF